MSDTNMSNEEKLKRALLLYYGDQAYEFTASEIINAVDEILWFYTCGKDKDEIQELSSKKDSKRKPAGMNRVYDYNHDAKYIYSAFRQQYQVNLQREKIHWWEFKAMFESLSDQCEFVKIMGYRSIKIDNNMTKSQKEFYSEMKRIHALPLPKSERQKLRAMEEALLRGESLEGIINAPG